MEPLHLLCHVTDTVLTSGDLMLTNTSTASGPLQCPRGDSEASSAHHVWPHGGLSILLPSVLPPFLSLLSVFGGLDT